MSQRGRVVPLTVPGGQRRIYTVSQLTNDIRNTLEDRLGTVVVQGEVSSVSTHGPTGHTYFCLKDAQSQISGVLYADRGTPAMRQMIREGLALQVEGDITVYPKKGEYQLRAHRIQAVGYGALQAQYEAMKRKLEMEGLFAPERKRALPRYPTRIGIVTSASAAAYQDMVRILLSRAPYVAITLGDTRVQGVGAAPEIATAIARMNALGNVEVIVVGRGGGAPEDLWAFNEEPVVRAIVRSRVPVVSAVGHETDITLADLAADVRAATPTHAAQLVVKELREIQGTLRDLSEHARERIVREIRDAASRLRGFETHHALRHPLRRVEDGYQDLDRIEERLARGLGGWVTARLQRTELLGARIRAHAPSRSFERARDRIEAAGRRAVQSLAASIARRRERVEHKEQLLHAFDHHQVLERGYALIWSEEGARLLKRGAGLASGDTIEVQFLDARAGAKVTKVVPSKKETT